MTKKNCQNCKEVIGHLEESYSYYGQVICKSCMNKLEKPLQDSETTNRNIEIETPIENEQTEQDTDIKSQIPEAVVQATTNLKKDTEHFEDKAPSGEDDNYSANKIVNVSSGRVLTDGIDAEKVKPRRYLTQLTILWIGIGIFVLFGLFPPTGSSRWPYDFILAGPSVDVSLLCIHWAITVVVTSGLIYTLKVDLELKNKTNALCFWGALIGLMVFVGIVILGILMSVENM